MPDRREWSSVGRHAGATHSAVMPVGVDFHWNRSLLFSLLVFLLLLLQGYAYKSIGRSCSGKSPRVPFCCDVSTGRLLPPAWPDDLTDA